MLQQRQFSIYDLQGFRRTQESLDELLIRKDYRLSEPTLKEKLTQPNKTLQNRKEELLTKACQELGLANVIFEFKNLDLVNNKYAIKAMALEAIQDQKNLLDLMLAAKVNRKIAELLKSEAQQIFAYNQQMEAYKLAIADILAKENSEAFYRNQNAAANSKMQLEAQLFAMRQNIHGETMVQLNDIFNQVDKLAKRYTEIQEMRKRNNERHVANIDHMMDDCEVEGQKLFSNEDKKHVQSLLVQKNVAKNEIEIIDRQIDDNKQIVAEATQALGENQAAQIAILRDIQSTQQAASPAEQAFINECLDSFSESAACELEEHLCADELKKLSKDKMGYESSAKKTDGAQKTQIINKIEKISIEELRLQEKIAALKEKQEKIKEKQNKRIESFTGSKNKITANLQFAQFQLLRNEERELKQRIERAEGKIEGLSQKRNSLQEKLHGVVHRLDDAFHKPKKWVQTLLSDDKAAAAADAKLEKLQKDIEEESEVSRQEDNALAEEAASTAKEMHELAASADAVAAVGASCSAAIGNVAPHSKHNETLSRFQTQENEAKARIHATVGAAMGASVGLKRQASVG